MAVIFDMDSFPLIQTDWSFNLSPLDHTLGLRRTLVGDDGSFGDAREKGFISDTNLAGQE